MNDIISNDTAPRETSCPQCNANQKINPVTSLSPGDQELEKLFKGKLNLITCAKCGAEFLFQTPLLFIDDERCKLIYYVPAERREAWRETEKEMDQITGAIIENNPAAKPYDCRLTLTRRSFIEKITLISQGRDDRLIEFIKYQLFRHPDDKIDPMRTELLYDFTEQAEDQLTFIIFDRETGKPTGKTQLPMQLYDELAESFLKDDDLKDEMNSLFPGSFINVEKILGLC